MYFSRQPLPERGVRELRSLRFSLNTPVISIEDLAVGPARAAIAVQDLSEGRATLQLVVRSQRTGQLACFAHDEPLAGEVSTQIALDGALSFAESMGFLFDDDAIPELGADGPREAAAAWNDLLGVAAGDAPVSQADAAANAADADELETGDELETDDGDTELETDPESDADEPVAELWLEVLAVTPANAAASAPEIAAAAPDTDTDTDPAPPLLLTKFRRSAAGPSARRNGWPIRLLSHF